MDLFYIRHHILSITRSKSFGGEVIAFLLVFVLSVSGVPALYNKLDVYAADLSAYFGHVDRPFEFFVFCCFLLDLGTKVVFNRPYPKMKYYLFWVRKIEPIASQYLFTSLFGILPFLFFVPQATLASKTAEWLGTETGLLIMALFLFNHFLGLALQYSHKRTKAIFGTTLVLLVVLYGVLGFPFIGMIEALLKPSTVVLLLVLSLVGAFLSVNRKLRKRELVEKGGWFSRLSLPSLSFKNPLFQLEWALIVRNKRTRSNLLMGMISVMILPFLMDRDYPDVYLILIFMIATSFFIIQHGVYSLGWEGSYFDFLITNVSIQSFLQSRYIFYVVSCVLGFLLTLVPSIINGLDIILLINVFVFNVGVTIPLVLFRSLFNSTKIELSENSLINYNGMVTGPIMLTSFLVVGLPFVFYGIGRAILGAQFAYLLGFLGFIGLLCRSYLLSEIGNSLSDKKYHLSQAFKS